MKQELLLNGGVVFGTNGCTSCATTTDVRIVDGVITEIGRGLGTREGTVLDLSDKCILPGLVDLHFHTALGKGKFDDLPLHEWLDAWWYPILRAMDPETAYWAGMLAYADAVRSGTTCVNDMSRHLSALASAADAIGIRAHIANTIADPEFDLDTLSDTVDALDKVTAPLVTVRGGIEWMPYTSRETLEALGEVVAERDIGLHLHLNESTVEVARCESRHGMRPTELAYATGLLGPNTVAAHGVWLSEHEINLLSSTGTRLSHNPSANGKLGNGIAPLASILSAGITVGLGHDAAESNNSRDLFEVAKFASLVHRASAVDPSLLSAPEVLRMATAGGATALGTGGGVVEVGRTADLTVVDLASLTFVPLDRDDSEQLAAHLAFAADGRDVDTVIVAGRTVYADGHLTLVDEDEIRREANRCFRKIAARVGIGAARP